MGMFDINNLSSMENFLAANMFLSGKNSPESIDFRVLDILRQEKYTPDANAHPNILGWMWTIAGYNRMNYGMKKGFSVDNLKEIEDY